MTQDLALFDIDGTLVKGDTLPRFMHFAVGTPVFLLSFLWSLPWIVGWKLGLVANDVAKRRWIGACLGGLSREDLLTMGKLFVENDMLQSMWPGAAERVRAHTGRGDEVWFVSASSDMWLQSFAELFSVGLLCSEMAFDKEGFFTGQWKTPNCHGAEKVERVHAVVQRERFGRVYAYGDSSGDKQMLAWADESFYRPFRDGEPLPALPPRA